jgi:hypothetical protein
VHTGAVQALRIFDPGVLQEQAQADRDPHLDGEG